MQRLDPASRRDAYGGRINRAHSASLATVVPWLSILLGSLLQTLPIASALPMLPPLGFAMLLGWRLVRPGLLPVWAGFPLGMFDDLFSGQPFGSAILLWSLVMLLIEIIEARVPWRGFAFDWLLGGAILVGYLLVGALVSGVPLGGPVLVAMGPQVVLSVLLFPLVSRAVSALDRLRLTRVRVLR
jgi:rod shape-determining protein MreD